MAHIAMTQQHIHPTDDDDELFGSPTEQCGFACHVIALSIMLIYTAYVVVVSVNPELAPISVWLRTLPATTVFLFYAAPLVYGGLINTRLIARAENPASLTDEHTRMQSRIETTTENDTKNESILEICDLDVGYVNDTIALGDHR